MSRGPSCFHHRAGGGHYRISSESVKRRLLPIWHGSAGRRAEESGRAARARVAAAQVRVRNGENLDRFVLIQSAMAMSTKARALLLLALGGLAGSVGCAHEDFF